MRMYTYIEKDFKARERELLAVSTREYFQVSLNPFLFNQNLF